MGEVKKVAAKKKLTIHEVLVIIQQELKAPKNQWNKFGKYAYRNNEDIMNAVKPLATAHGCTVVQGDDLQVAGDRYYIKATTRLTNGTDSVEASAFAREPDNLKGQSAAQITGGSSSYARKYSANGLFAIDDSKDSDHEAGAKTKVDEHTKNSDGELIAEKAKKMIQAELVTLAQLEQKFIFTDEMKKWLTDGK